MKCYYVKGCSPGIIEDLCEPVRVTDNVGIYKFNGHPITILKKTKRYDILITDKNALTEIVQRHLKLKIINLEIKTFKHN